MKNRRSLSREGHIHTRARRNERREERGREEGKEEKKEEEEEEEGICSSGANYVNENGERIASVQ